MKPEDTETLEVLDKMVAATRGKTLQDAIDAVVQLVELKEAGRLWLEAHEKYSGSVDNRDLLDAVEEAELASLHRMTADRNLEAVFRRILDADL